MDDAVGTRLIAARTEMGYDRRSGRGEQGRAALCRRRVSL